MAANSLMKITWGIIKNAVHWALLQSFRVRTFEDGLQKLTFTQDPQVVDLYKEPLVISWSKQP